MYFICNVEWPISNLLHYDIKQQDFLSEKTIQTLQSHDSHLDFTHLDTSLNWSYYSTRDFSVLIYFKSKYHSPHVGCVDVVLFFIHGHILLECHGVFFFPAPSRHHGIHHHISDLYMVTYYPQYYNKHITHNDLWIDFILSKNIHSHAKEPRVLTH